jgi:hypothetical protein
MCTTACSAEADDWAGCVARRWPSMGPAACRCGCGPGVGARRLATASKPGRASGAMRRWRDGPGGGLPAWCCWRSIGATRPRPSAAGTARRRPGRGGIDAARRSSVTASLAATLAGSAARAHRGLRAAVSSVARSRMAATPIRAMPATGCGTGCWPALEQAFPHAEWPGGQRAARAGGRPVWTHWRASIWREPCRCRWRPEGGRLAGTRPAAPAPTRCVCGCGEASDGGRRGVVEDCR